MLMTAPYVLIVHGSVPANSMQERMPFAKKNPGKLNYSSFGEVQMTFGNLGVVMQQLREGKVKGLAVRLASAFPRCRRRRPSWNRASRISRQWCNSTGTPLRKHGHWRKNAGRVWIEASNWSRLLPWSKLGMQ